MDINDLLQGQLPPGLVDQLSQQLGVGDRQKTATAASGIVSTLVSAMAKNAASPEGASALAGALDRDHDGSILDDIMGMVTGQNQAANTKATNGAGILGHILGGRQGGAVDIISQMSGLNNNQTGNLMTMLAPIIMGALGKAKRSQNLNPTDIASILSGQVQQQKQVNPNMGLIGKLLDQDGDGSIMDDVGGMLLKNLFKRRR